MSYSVRNSLVLLLTLALMVTGGWLYLKYQYDDVIEAQNAEIIAKDAEVVMLTEKAANYTAMENALNQVRFEYDNHSKQFFPTSSVSIMFDYLRSINFGQAETTMNFTLVDSSLHPQYGVTRVRLAGEGTYSGFYNFITTLEQSKPLSKVTDIRISASPSEQLRDQVSFEATVLFYYARGTNIMHADLLFVPMLAERLYNPFSPLVRPATQRAAEPPPPATPEFVPPPNVENLPVIDKSKLVGLVRSGAYIEDHNGQTVYLPIGARVYLGVLNQISLSQKTATFRLTRGSRSEDVTLRISDNQ